MRTALTSHMRAVSYYSSIIAIILTAIAKLALSTVNDVSSLSLTSAFARYGAKLANPQWAVSAINPRGELVVSCWKHYLIVADGKLCYRDHLSRWDGNTAGNNLLRDHLNKALADDLPVRLVIAKTEATDIVDSGQDASQVSKTFGVRDELMGRVISFDGDNFEFEFVREAAK